MLDAWIIEKIRRREDEERRRRYEQPMLEIPEDDAYPTPPPARERDRRDEPERGVVIIDFRV